MLAFALQQMKAKYRLGITEVQGHLPRVVMFGQWNQRIQITSHLNSLEGSDDFPCVFASNFVFIWVISIAWVCARACAWVASENLVFSPAFDQEP